MRSAAAAMVVVVLCGATLLGACGPGRGGEDDSTDGSHGSGPPDRVELVVSAAASLSNVLDRIATSWEDDHPGVRIIANYGASGDLAAQLVGGAPADIVALASHRSMVPLIDAGLVTAPRELVRNTLAIVTKPANPLRIGGLGDLPRARVVALCAPAAPCGAIAERLLDEAGVSLPADRVTRARDARATLGAVATGDADAAIVWVTDANAAADRVEVVSLPAGLDASTVYEIAVVADSPHRRDAEAFVRFVLSTAGRRILADDGFQPAGASGAP